MRKRILPGVLVAAIMMTMSAPTMSAYSVVETSSISVIESGKSYTPQYEGMFMYAVDEDEGSSFISGIEYDGETTIAIPEKLGGYPVTALYKGTDPYSGKEFNLFSGMSNLKGVSIPNTVTYIDTGAFKGCTSLESVRLPNSLVYILDGTFDGCTSLKEVFIPSTIKVISDDAFTNCPNLKTIKTDGNSAGISSFVNRNSKMGISILNENASSSDTDVGSPDTDLEEKPNVPYYWGDFTYLVKDGKVTIIDVNVKSEDIVIPAKINGKPVVALNRGIGDKEMHLFEGSNIKSIAIPDSVSYIADGAFEGCNKLASVTMSSSVSKIFKRTFADCTSLKSISLPDSIAYLDDTAFEGCSEGFVILHSGKSQGINSYLFRHRDQDGNKKSTSDTDKNTDSSKDDKLSDTDVTSDSSDVGVNSDLDSNSSDSDHSASDTDSEDAVSSDTSDVDIKGSDTDGKDSDTGGKDSDIDSNKNMFGDIDHDNNITSADALLVLRISVGLNKIEEGYFKYADVDCDGNITSADALAILRHSVGQGTNSLIGKYNW